MEETKKLSYEELEKVAAQMGEQSRQLYSRVQQLENVAFFKRVEYLFMVLKYASAFSDEFVQKCATEIQNTLTVEDVEEDRK